jgi:hypothetical protein
MKLERMQNRRAVGVEMNKAKHNVKETEEENDYERTIDEKKHATRKDR